MSMRYFLFVFAIACGGGVKADPGDAGTQALPSGLGGTFNLAAVDEVNMAVEADGTFRWRINGCDFGGGDCGRWKREGEKIVLSPAQGKSSLEWSVDTGFKTQVSNVTVTSSVEGKIVVAGTIAASGKPFTQTWTRGR